jgi:hypothetical protein
MNPNRFQIISPHDLTDYRPRAGDIADAAWPEFMLHDTIANENWHELFDRFSEYQFAMLDTEINRMAAMANSLPVVSTRHAGIPEAVVEGRTGYLVEEGDSVAMAERVVALAGDPERGAYWQVLQ